MKLGAIKSTQYRRRYRSIERTQHDRQFIIKSMNCVSEMFEAFFLANS